MHRSRYARLMIDYHCLPIQLNKKSFVPQGRRSCSAVPPCLPAHRKSGMQAALVALTGETRRRLEGLASASRSPAKPGLFTPVAQQASSALFTVLCGHLAGLTPRSPGSLADGLLLLLASSIQLSAFSQQPSVVNTTAASVQLIELIADRCRLSVDPEGFEPSAFSMPLRRAPNCAMGP